MSEEKKKTSDLIIDLTIRFVNDVSKVVIPLAIIFAVANFETLVNKMIRPKGTG